ncbi:MAG: acetyl-CoA C-acyltransferase, partial [Thermoplasmata archaeon]|nr:acetyl-CoA C-acyltransferase [Candidatus Sysuiplasma superficiale]
HSGTDENSRVIETDQSIRPDTTLEKLAALKPAFKEGGLITAGNSSPLNAGASLVMLMSGRKVNELGLDPLARVVSFGWASGDPSIMGAMVVPAIRRALKSAGIGVDDVDLWEINEAFAVVVINAVRELGIDMERVNVNGGAISIGHPLGASGTRLAGTASRMLHSGRREYAVAAVCVGGGQGYSVVLQKA